MPGAFAGHYLDGRSAARQPATIRLTATGLDIALESGATLWWPFAEVRQTQGFYAGQQIRLERGAPLAAVLLVDDFGFLAALHTAAPVLTRRFHDPRRRRARVQLTVLAALAVVGVAAALYVWGIPAAAGAVAARVPASWEERLGNAIVADLASSGRQCVDPEREAVIGGIVRRLLAPLPSVPYTFRVTVLDDGSVNALAVPGGQIILLRGLLERTRTPGIAWRPSSGWRRPPLTGPHPCCRTGTGATWQRCARAEAANGKPASSGRSRHQVEVVLDDPGCRAPDDFASPVVEVHGTHDAVALPVLHPEVGALDERGEWHLDHLLDLFAVRSPDDGLADDADPRRDDELSGEGLRVVERAEGLDGRAREADLLLRLPQRGVQG